MTKALIKKQMMEMFSFIWQDKKKSKARTGGKLAASVILYIILFGLVASMFFGLSFAMCIALVPAGLSWLYFAVNGLFAVLFGTFGSVFNTFASLYKAKDNDMLLAMPIKPSKLLLIRLMGVYAMGLLYELIVMVPALIVYFIFGNPSVMSVILSILITFVLSVFILTLSAVLGWVVALISNKTKNKSFITVALSLIFLGAYYYFFAQSSNMLKSFLTAPQVVGDFVKVNLSPIYLTGLAADGDITAFLIVTAVIAALFGILFYVLSRSYIKISTTNKGEKKKKYTEQAAKPGNANSALFRKELKRFTGSSSYMLNCGLGIVLMIVAAVALLINGENISTLAAMLETTDGLAPLIACAVLCVISSMNDITAPSVSLEGNNIWLVQSLPVSPWQVLRAKLKLHLLMTIPPAFLLTAAIEFIIKPAPVYAVLIPIIIILFIIFMAELGLTVNLKSPNLNWTSEIVPIKQSMGVMFALFSGWVLVIILGVLYFAVMQFISPLVYMIFLAVLLAAASILNLMWLKNKGCKIFAAL